MSKAMADARRRIVAIYGEEAGRVLDHLVVMGVLDDVLARRYVLRSEYFHKMRIDSRRETAILLELSDEWGVSREGIMHICK